MREIKFRIFENGEMSNLDCLHLPHIEKSIELMQYTGLKDKNGVEIYEGDIVSINIPKEHCEVVFQEGAFNIVSEEMQSVDNGYNMEFYEYEGNIHENPDLLK